MVKISIERTVGKRQEDVLGAVIREYVRSAEPVGSQTLVEGYDFDVSPATLRNDMLLLEQLGFLVSPHTSAGRVPTETGYRYYVQNILESAPLAKIEETRLREVWAEHEALQELVKKTAQVVANLATETVFISFGRKTMYTTGFQYLFSQPEFRQQAFVAEVGRLIDHLDQTMAEIFDDVGEETQVQIGSESRFGRDVSAIVSRIVIKHDTVMFGILGPTRMDYDANIARINFVRDELVENL